MGTRFTVALLALLLIASPAHAQVTCSGGQVPVYSPNTGSYTCETVGGSSSSGGGSSSSSSSGGDSSSSSGGGGGSGSSFAGVMSDFAKWLKDVLLYVPKWCWQELLSALGGLIASIPAPSWFQTFAQGMGGFTSQAVWWLDLVQFKAGLGMVSAALLARFLLRRIPLIG